MSIDKPLNDIPFAIVCFFKRTSATFILSASDGAANMLLVKILPEGLAGVGFIGYHPLRTQTFEAVQSKLQSIGEPALSLW